MSVQSPDTQTSGVETYHKLDQFAALQPEMRDSLPDLSGAPNYMINLQIGEDLSNYTGLARIIYTNAEDVNLDRIYFRLLANADAIFGDGSLLVKNIQIDGEKTKASLSLDDTLLEIPLRNPLPPGESIQVEIDFQGVVPSGASSSGYGVYSLNQDVLNLAGWYPLVVVYDEGGWNLDPISYLGDAVYADISTYTLLLSAPEDLVIAATGVELSRKLAAGRQEIQFVSGPVREFALSMSTEFSVQTTTVDGITINAYYLPGHDQANQLGLSVAADSLAIFGSKFGLYPYQELDIVDVPLQNISGVEYPGIVFIRSSYYDSPNNPVFSTVVAHEVAHQWWYNVVGNDVFGDPWMDEALATYSSLLYFEFEHGESASMALTDYWQQSYQAVVDGSQDHPITQSVEYFESLGNPNLYSAIVYSKGALFFVALRGEIGGETFFQALNDYYHNYSFRIAQPQDLLSTFERSSGRSLADFYHGWLYTP